MFELKHYNTFGIAAQCKIFKPFSNLSECIQHLDRLESQPLIWGGGSNVLLVGNIAQPILHNCIKGIEIVDESSAHVWIHVGGGEIWHEVVRWSVDKNLGGLENLSLIPGTTGAAPMQNIGAYGVELQSVLENVEFLNLSDQRIQVLTKDECKFGYRDSVFKQEWKGKACISSVVLKLNKVHTHQLILDYGEVRQELSSMNVSTPNVKTVSEAISRIRRRKLPDPAELGNAGSFFKNPLVTMSHYQYLKTKYPTLPSYPFDHQQVKIPAAWLIEQAGWKGHREGDAGVHKKHALVLVNYGRASGKDIWSLAQKIMASIADKFEILLHPEVNVLGLD